VAGVNIDDADGEAAIDPDQLVVALFATDGAALVRPARLFTDDPNAAEDLVQEALIRPRRSARRVRDPAYLRSIVLNLDATTIGVA
jgi:DNA-directed RNA polymerase specialized sigma24 family protein